MTKRTLIQTIKQASHKFRGFDCLRASHPSPVRHLRLVATVWGCAVLLWPLSALLTSEGMLLNLTPSVPVGLWHVSPLQPADVRPGQVVRFCPPDTSPFRQARERGYIPQGSCLGNYAPLLKVIGATPGDTVDVTPTGIRINGIPVAATKPLKQDTHHRPMTAWPPGLYRVFPHTVWLLSSHAPNGFDSRYFGPVSISHLTGKADPLITLGKTY